MQFTFPHSLICVILLFSCFNIVSSRHAHRAPVHKHHRRQNRPPGFVLVSQDSGQDSGSAVTTPTSQSTNTVDTSSTDTTLVSASSTESVTTVSPSSTSTASSGATTQASQVTTSQTNTSPSIGSQTSVSQTSTNHTNASQNSASQTSQIAGSGGPVSSTLTASLTSQSSAASTVTVTVTVSYASNTTLTISTGSAAKSTNVTTSASSTSSTASLGNTTTSTNVTSSSSPTASPYQFNASAPNNLAVYYGQAPDTNMPGDFIALCNQTNVDIVILAFVYVFFGPNGYPVVNFGHRCPKPNAAQMAQAPGLRNCTVLAPEITACQQLGKKVLVSLGGENGDSYLESDGQAQQFASTLWNLFGAGRGLDPNLRPFGPNVTVDGFDIDNENKNSSFYGTLGTALRQEYAQDANRTYYLSAAPQCPIPDESIPVGLMAVSDFVWVQFYNNMRCNLDSNGFQSSFAAWSNKVYEASGTLSKPRLYIGAGSFSGAGSGYVAGSGLSARINLATELHAINFGGIMLWDGTRALENVDETGVNYLQYAKNALP